jgi:CubicO group peptidase (beta-lactamase class C family)
MIPAIASKFLKKWKMISFTSLTVVATLIPCSSFSSVPDTSLINGFLLKTIKQFHIPGLAVAVVNSNGVIFASGFGVSNGNSITPATPFLLGSTTKTFTALAVMRLVEEGKIFLDSAVHKYIPDFTLASPEYVDAITVRHLLNHTSGLSDDGMPYASMGESSLEKELALLRQCSPFSEPGMKYTYFNANYRLLGLIIERVTGMKYGEFLSREIFRPLSMRSTFAGPEGVTDLAAGHGAIFGFPFKRKQEFRPGALPSGYLVSSVSDISQLLTAELRGGEGDSILLKHEYLKLTWQPPADIKGGYAMGWMVFDTIGKTSFLGHGGALESYQSFFYLNPELNLGFVFMMNQGGIIPSYGGFSALRNGLIKLMDGEAPEDGHSFLLLIIVISIFFLITGLELYLLLRLRTLSTVAGQKKRWRRLAAIIFDLTIAVLLTILLYKGWSMISFLLPELFILLWIMIIAGFLRSIVKISLMLRNRILLF